ncbi:isopentenyltransferase, partial [Trema orientale]
KQVQPLVSFQGGAGSINPLSVEAFFRPKDKVVFVIGATGTGKSRLAIDLATRLDSGAEIINSDKMQVYKGLDIATNKVTDEECRGVPHHMLGTVADPQSNFSAADFCHDASAAVESILDGRRLPIIAGGSNSYVQALISDHARFRLRYECCFLWVDVSLPVLRAFVSERVDRMVAAGLVNEVRKIFDPASADYSRGIRRAIGVPELDEYLRAERRGASERAKARLLQSAIEKIKENTWQLACRQLQKIDRLNYGPWSRNVRRLDATEAFLRRGRGHGAADEAWESHVAGPGTKIVRDFLAKDSLYGEGIAAMVPSDAVLTGRVPIAAGAGAR